MDPVIPRRPRSLNPIAYRYGNPGSIEHMAYRLSRFLQNLQGGPESDDDTRALGLVRLAIQGSYLPAGNNREPNVILASDRVRNQGPVEESIVDFMLFDPHVQAVTIRGARRDRSAQIQPQDYNQDDARLLKLVYHVTQVLQLLRLYGRRTIRLENIRTIVDTIYPQRYNGNVWDRFAQRGHVLVDPRDTSKHVIIRHSLGDYLFYSVAKLYP